MLENRLLFVEGVHGIGRGHDKTFTYLLLYFSG